MDERLYTYEYRRPRPSNPTQQITEQHSNSYHVSNSLSFFANQLQYLDKLHSRYHPSDFHQRQPYHIEHDPKPAGVVNKSLEVYSPRGPESPRNIQNPSSRGSNGPGSRLSRYGTGVLQEQLPAHHLPLNERDIYKKQEKEYNIINLKDRDNRDSIKMYPKLSKEDFQARYVADQRQQEATQFKQLPIAGKPAYGGGRRGSSYDPPVAINPKSLKNADEVYM